MNKENFMPARPLIRTLCLFSILSLAPIHAETLTRQGSQLSQINVYPDQSAYTLEKNIDLNGINVSQTHIIVRLKNGALLQKQADGSFSLFDGNISTLSNLGLSANNDKLNFEVASGQFLDLLEYPLTVYLGITDIDNQLYYGAFSLSAELETLASWDETAVRKVLHNFAYGGFASDAQIQTWAAMQPSVAIQEILTLDDKHALLSPPEPDDALNDSVGSLKDLSVLWSANASNNPINPEIRDNYNFEYRNGAETVWRQAVNLRGLNPVRQHLSFWETNYHLSVNLDAEVGINNYQMARYYDDLSDALKDKSYQEVLSTASLSAAVATQFNHRRNQYDNDSDTFRGNEDFAREYHQIFFGILGAYDTEYHEEITIKNTAKALTDMPIELKDGHLDEIISFGTDKHYQAPLEMLGLRFSGDNAVEKIQAMSIAAIQHPESLINLPIILARGLADDNLDAAKIKVLQNTWASLAEPNLLQFLQAYASSSLFHHSARIKYASVIDRYMRNLNLITLNNAESYRDIYKLADYQDADVQVFRPLHDVFGGQTGAEAADSAEVFRVAYNRSTEHAHINRRAVLIEDGTTVWRKDWGAVIPVDAAGQYSVATVLNWLWQRFNADGLKNLGSLERFHLAALLATGNDAGYELDPADAERIFSSTEIDTDETLKTALNTWLNSNMSLKDNNLDNQQTANERIGQAINFLNAIPFSFAQEGA